MPNDQITTLTVIERADGEIHLAFTEMDCNGVDGETRGYVDLPNPMELPEVTNWIADSGDAESYFIDHVSGQEFKQIRRDVRESAWNEGNDEEPVQLMNSSSAVDQ